MQWLNPVWFWGLLGLSVPLAIHLLSRKEGKVIKVGSLRYMSDSTTRRFRSVKLNEILLLALRSLLILLIVLYMVGLLFFTKEKGSRWIIVERGFESAVQTKPLIDSLQTAGYELHYLEKGFPAPEDTTSLYSIPNYWSLVGALERENLEEAIIFSPARVVGFRGVRQALPANITWLSVPANSTTSETTSLLDGGERWVISGHSEASFTWFDAVKSADNSSPENIAAPVTQVTIVADPKFSHDKRILSAAMQVLDDLPGIQLQVNNMVNGEINQQDSSLLFWLSEKPLPSTLGKLVYLQESADPKLITQVFANQWQITKRLNQKAALEHHLVAELSKLFQVDFPVELSDQRQMPETWRWKNGENDSQGGAGEQVATTDGSGWLAALILLTLLAERIVAWRRQQ